ncbi:MAG: alpha/beta hydrolase [Cyclobacteriaceae bacterium]
MNIIKKNSISIVLLSLSLSCIAQKQDSIIYKIIKNDTVANIELKMDIIYPKKYSKNKKLTAMVFFFGGGWVAGNTAHFKRQAMYFASRGFVCFLPQYRTKKSHQTTPKESLKDAKSAIRYIKSNSKKYHIDPNKIIASGGSAGGQLAAAVATTIKINGETDDLSISTIPNALVLFNPVVDNGPGGYGYDRVKDYYLDFSPMHNIKKSTPPTLFLLGTKDLLVPVSTAKNYKNKMENEGSRCDVWLFKDQEHAFFNFKESKESNYNYYRTVYEADRFLASLGYLKGKPKVKKLPNITDIEVYELK